MGLHGARQSVGRTTLMSGTADGAVSIVAGMVILCLYLYRKLKSAEKRAAANAIQVTALKEAAEARARAGALAMLAEFSNGGNTVHCKDVVDAIRGRRDPLNPFAAQKSRWPPQRMDFMARRFANQNMTFDLDALSAMCEYITAASECAAAEELTAAWEEVERLRHKTKSRESLAPPPAAAAAERAQLLPATQLRHMQ